MHYPFIHILFTFRFFHFHSIFTNMHQCLKDARGVSLVSQMHVHYFFHLYTIHSERGTPWALPP